jgi:Fur family zinc uptake transcriptional regulator
VEPGVAGGGKRRNGDQDVLEIGRRLIAAEAICASRGLRLNGAGRRVLKALLNSDRPLKAYDLTYELGDGARSAAPPTVYRALKLLIGAGLAHRIETLNAFVACCFPDETHLAGFFVCESCGATEEVRLDALPAQVGERDHDRLVFEVVKPCAVCRARETTQPSRN